MSSPVPEAGTSRDGRDAAGPDPIRLSEYIAAVETFVRLGEDLELFPSSLPDVKRATEAWLRAKSRFETSFEWRADPSLSEFLTGFDRSVGAIALIMERGGLHVVHPRRAVRTDGRSTWYSARRLRGISGWRVTPHRHLGPGPGAERTADEWRVIYNPPEILLKDFGRDPTPFLQDGDAVLLRRCIEKMGTALGTDGRSGRASSERPRSARDTVVGIDEMMASEGRHHVGAGTTDGVERQSRPGQSVSIPTPTRSRSLQESEESRDVRAEGSATDRPRAKARPRRDGSQSHRVTDYLTEYLESYLDSERSGNPTVALETQKAIAERLKVSPSTVSRVVKPWMVKYKKMLNAKMFSGWKDSAGRIEAIFKDETG